MIDLRKLAVPGLILVGATLLAGCGDPEPAASPTATEDAMMEDDKMSEDAMMSDEPTHGDEMMSEEATSDG